MSPRDIHATIIKEEQSRRQKHKDQQQQEEIFSKALQLFSEGKSPVQVAITLNLGPSQITKLYRGYWKLKRLHILNLLHTETNGKLGPFLKLYKELIKKKGMTIEQVGNVVEIAIHKLPHMESLYRQIKDEVNKLHHIRQGLLNDIATLKYKISILDKAAFSIEQDCRRTKQQLQELTAKKDRIEKSIANIMNEQGYSKLVQIVKENVKTILSDKRILISVSFAVLIQTLKADPQIVKLIHKIPIGNNGEQNKDNNDNVTNYFIANKDNLLDLAEKHYENLVEALTNNAINAIDASSLNPTLSSPQSSSTFPNSFDQIDTFRKEESEIYDNSKGDIE